MGTGPMDSKEVQAWGQDPWAVRAAVGGQDPWAGGAAAAAANMG